MKIAPMLNALVALEQQVSAAAAALDPDDELRVEMWRPTAKPELPGLWNWIDDGSYEIVDTARADRIIIVTATIAVPPGDHGETMDRLVRLTDIFLDIVDPALNQNQPLDGTAKKAKPIVTRTSGDEWGPIQALCMDTLIRVELPKIIV